MCWQRGWIEVGKGAYVSKSYLMYLGVEILRTQEKERKKKNVIILRFLGGQMENGAFYGGERSRGRIITV